MDDGISFLVKQVTKAEHKRQLDELDRRSLSKLKDKELALWQSEYPADSPQFILAEHEWQRRLTAEQVKASRFTAFIGLLGTVIGALITWLATK